MDDQRIILSEAKAMIEALPPHLTILPLPPASVEDLTILRANMLRDNNVTVANV